MTRNLIVVCVRLCSLCYKHRRWVSNRTNVHLLSLLTNFSKGRLASALTGGVPQSSRTAAANYHRAGHPVLSTSESKRSNFILTLFLDSKGSIVTGGPILWQGRAEA